MSGKSGKTKLSKKGHRDKLANDSAQNQAQQSPAEDNEPVIHSADDSKPGNTMGIWVPADMSTLVPRGSAVTIDDVENRAFPYKPAHKFPFMDLKNSFPDMKPPEPVVVPSYYQKQIIEAVEKADRGNYKEALGLLDDISKSLQPFTFKKRLNPIVSDEIRRTVAELKTDWTRKQAENSRNLLVLLLEWGLFILAICVATDALFSGKNHTPLYWNRGGLGQVVTVLSFVIGGLPALLIWIMQGDKLWRWADVINKPFRKKNEMGKMFDILVFIYGCFVLVMFLQH